MQVLRGDATRELEVSGSAAELTHLAEVLLSGSGTVDLDHVEDPSPYSRCLARINVVRASGPVVVACAAGSGELDVRGGAPQLDLLAANVRAFAEAEDPAGHLHVDHFPGHDYLAESSDPLVLVFHR